MTELSLLVSVLLVTHIHVIIQNYNCRFCVMQKCTYV